MLYLAKTPCKSSPLFLKRLWIHLISINEVLLNKKKTFDETFNLLGRLCLEISIEVHSALPAPYQFPIRAVKTTPSWWFLHGIWGGTGSLIDDGVRGRSGESSCKKRKDYKVELHVCGGKGVSLGYCMFRLRLRMQYMKAKNWELVVRAIAIWGSGFFI